MTRYEYQVLRWGSREQEAAFVAELNAAGANGWKAIGVAPRSVAVAMPGMGADAVPEMVVVMRRELEV